MEVMISFLKVGHLKKNTNEFSIRKTAALDQAPPGSQASSRGEAKDSALLSIRDAGLLARSYVANWKCVDQNKDKHAFCPSKYIHLLGTA